MTRKADRPRETEHGIQSAFIEWVRMNQGRYPQLAVGHSVPNGAALAHVMLPSGKWSRGTKQASKLLREGMLPGILDWHLPVRGRGHEIGLWLEFKRPGEHMSEEQVKMAGLLIAQGHRVEEVDSPEKAIDITEDYLGVPQEERTQHFR